MPRIGAFMLAAFWLVGCSSGESGGAAAAAAAPQQQDGAAPPAPVIAEPAPSALYVLGDSLSDIGNVARAADHLLGFSTDPPTVGFCNPAEVLVMRRPCDDLFFGHSRVSDGPVAVEHLAAHLGLAELKPSLHLTPRRSKTATAYAVASAKARSHGDADLSRQLEWLLLDHAPLPGDAVYVVMIGGNDAIDALQADARNPEARPRPSAAIVTSAVAAIASSVERLLDLGARQIVVANVPDLATLPAVREVALAQADSAALLAHASAIAAAFDAELNAALDSIAGQRHPLLPAAAIRRFDLRAAHTAALEAAAASGANVHDACFDSDVYRASAAAERVFHPDCAPLSVGDAPRFSEFAYWDRIHPTGAMHAQLGAALSASF